MSLRFQETSIIPDEEFHLIDVSRTSCASFNVNRPSTGKPWFVNFRIKFSNRENGIKVNLTGTNLRCGDMLNVMPISNDQTQKWTGQFSRCPLLDTITDDGKERCSFDCQCLERCEEIQVLRMPYFTSETSWTICDISVSG
ncbi:hypothetical protein LSH36_54g05000 [Paralvinella palmiformis]|uniref:Uncharacterized protein n=1 Tax=Paralvinella palmiformis TaxID=53620 RepID=A0AAD9K5P2_9ANNE|nr:hypothetical protein LSH36_54g05000 [Paralvinella palmiformis]